MTGKSKHRYCVWMQTLNLTSKPSMTSALTLKLYLISPCATARVLAAPLLEGIES